MSIDAYQWTDLRSVRIGTLPDGRPRYRPDRRRRDDQPGSADDQHEPGPFDRRRDPRRAAPGTSGSRSMRATPARDVKDVSAITSSTAGSNLRQQRLPRSELRRLRPVDLRDHRSIQARHRLSTTRSSATTRPASRCSANIARAGPTALPCSIAARGGCRRSAPSAMAAAVCCTCRPRMTRWCHSRYGH